MRGLTVRPVSAEDLRDIWVWRCDPLTRMNSLSTDIVPFEVHARWFSASLSDPDRLMRMVEVDGARCGIVRFDRLESRPPKLRVSININPDFRGQRIGGAALALCCADVEQNWPGSTFFAEIRSCNKSSLKLFRRCGFFVEHEHDEVLMLRRNPKELVTK